MKLPINNRSFSRSPNKLIFKSLTILVFIVTAFLIPAKSQDVQTTMPSFWVGVAGGANINFYRGTTQILNDDFRAPSAFHPGLGSGLFLGPQIEYRSPSTLFGIMFQGAYDSRQGKFEQILTPCNCPADLQTKLSYVSIEPSLLFSPFRSNFYLFAGPRFAFNIDKSFVYSQKNNPEFPDQQTNPDVTGDFSNVRSKVISAQVGAGYNIMLSPETNKVQWVISPFVSYHPYYGQNPREIETWNVNTIRFGATFKVGKSRSKSVNNSHNETPVSDVIFKVNAPKNIPVQRRVRETFPLRNYIFFNEGSNQIPSRYVSLRKDQVKDFKEDQLDVFKPKELSGRSDRQMIVYYNVINILGHRMQESPDANITLSGSSENGTDDGRAMAQSVKDYLVNIFEIDPSRITVEGRDKPRIPSEHLGGTTDLEMLKDGNRRVTIESTSPILLMEFQSGPDAPLKPVEIIALQEAPMDSYVSFEIESKNDPIKEWSMDIKNEEGVVKKFGPFTQTKVTIPGKSILGTQSEGDYTVTMTGKTKGNNIVKKETNVHMVLWTPPTDEEGMRFSVLYEYDKSETIKLYEKYLTEVIAPKIPKNGTVIIHGYSDIIGDNEYNKELSARRSKDVRSILANALAKTGRSDVKFDVYSFGEDEKSAPFANKFPEGRFYNRTVIIDIIPSE